MTTIDPDWQARVDALWERIDDYAPDGFVAAMHDATAERSPGVTDAVVALERAGSFDSVGRTAEAIPLYRSALAAGVAGSGTGLDVWRRRQATIQLASSLRALGQAEERRASARGRARASGAR
jgi:hypothetical protein